MSRKKNTSRPSGQHRTSRVAAPIEPALSIQVLEDRWKALHLQPQTRKHLEHLLQKEGLELVLVATTALALEMEREEQKLSRSLLEWTIEELRLLFLEEGCQHLIESSRLIVDAVLTWTLMQGPLLMKHLTLPLLVFCLLLISCGIVCVCRSVWRQASR
jgi:hypothetical protein